MTDTKVLYGAKKDNQPKNIGSSTKATRNQTDTVTDM